MTELFANNAFLQAVDFTDSYPFTRFMDSRHIDYESALLKADTHINVFLVGFGKVNREIFSASVCTNRFLTKKDGKLVSVPVRYLIFDRAASEKKLLLNDYYRYSRVFPTLCESDYLPLPDFPARESFFDCETGDTLWDNLEQACRNETSVNIAVVALSEKGETKRVAEEIEKRRREKNIDNLHIIANAITAGGGIFTFSRSKNADKLIEAAQRRNELYDVENLLSRGQEPTAQNIAETELSARDGWNRRSDFDKLASLMSILGIRVKMHLMGLDYCEKADARCALSESEYMNIYAEGDFPETIMSAGGRKIIRYNAHFPPSKRRNLAEQEHERWNACMLCGGYIPASREQIENEKAEKDGKAVYTNGKNTELKRHGNLTTFEGLEEFARITARRDGAAAEERDVIKYDYQLLDNAYPLLEKCGFKIVKRD